MSLAERPWVPAQSEALVHSIAATTRRATAGDIATTIEKLAEKNRDIHEAECFNLNPATNVMNPGPRRSWQPVSGRGLRLVIPATNTRWGWRRSRKSR